MPFLKEKRKRKKFTSPLYPHFNNLSSIVKQSFILNHRTNACFSIASGNQINFHKQLPAALIRFHSMFLHSYIFLSSRSSIWAYPYAWAHPHASSNSIFQFFVINAIFFSIFISAVLFYNSISILHIILLIASRKNLPEFQSLPRRLALNSFLYHALSLLF